MASSLEVRVPFLDLEFLRFIERIPAPLRVSLLRPKRLLREALEGILPAWVLKRPKRNFSPPDATWMEPGVDGPGLHWLQEPGSAASQFFSAAEIQRLVKDQETRRRDRRRQLFALLAFEIWHRSFLQASSLDLTNQEASKEEFDVSSMRPGRM
jgi:asparagine synthase (glutamine-hydrolysing)